MDNIQFIVGVIVLGLLGIFIIKRVVKTFIKVLLLVVLVALAVAGYFYFQ